MTEQEQDFVFDFSNVADGMEPIAEGEYFLEVVKAEIGTSQSGNPKIDVQFKVVEHEDDQINNRRVFETLSFHPSALWRTKAMLKALGFDMEGEVDIREVEQELVGMQINAFVKIQKSDKLNPETNEVYPPRNKVGKIITD